jgi:hypothetical protein
MYQYQDQEQSQHQYHRERSHVREQDMRVRYNFALNRCLSYHYLVIFGIFRATRAVYSINRNRIHTNRLIISAL